MKFLNIIMDLWSNDGCPTNDPQDTMKLKNVIQDAITDMTRQQIQIAPATVDQTITLPTATTNYVGILTDEPISIKINGVGTAIACTPKIAGRKTLVFFNKGTISALTVSNAGTVAANIDVIAAAH